MSENQRRSNRQLAVIILAAGQGTRMKSTLPKVLHRIGGAPAASATCSTRPRTLGPQHVLVVVRHERDLVADVVADIAPEIVVVDQDEIPGTGRAVEMALDARCPDFDGDVLVLSGDVPLLDAETLARLIRAHRESGAAATVLSAIVDDADRLRPHRPRRRRRRRADRRAEGCHRRRGADRRDQRRASTSSRRRRCARQLASSAPTTPRARSISPTSSACCATARLVGRRPSGRRMPQPRSASTTACSSRRPRRLLNARTVRRWQLEGVTDPRPGDDLDRRHRDASPPTSPCCPTRTSCGATTIAAGATIGPDTTPRRLRGRRGRHGHAHRRDARGDRRRRHRRPVRLPAAGHRPRAPAARSARSSRRRTRRSARAARCRTSPTSATRRSARESNLGAGAITANYDDVTKHRTEIGDEVHSGSHNVFVAPVRIGDGAKTGAGAVDPQGCPRRCSGAQRGPSAQRRGVGRDEPTGHGRG